MKNEYKNHKILSAYKMPYDAFKREVERGQHSPRHILNCFAIHIALHNAKAQQAAKTKRLDMEREMYYTLAIEKGNKDGS